jgi:precorrin-6B methylase 1
MSRVGSLTCVGLGMMLGAHLSPRSKAYIEQADVVFALVSDPLVELWVQEMRPDMRSLQPYYGDGTVDGKPRRDSYREMVDAMLAEVSAGKRVCGVFYGHPGVFALVPHKAIEEARNAGHEATMEPGISAEDCLYADLGIDPGTVGCQHFEAGQLVTHKRNLDPSAYLVLWQVAVVGDRTTRRFEIGSAYRELLVDVLAEAGYPRDHQVIVYEAATLPISAPRMDRIYLRDFAHTELRLQTTLVVPPARPMQRNQAVLDRIAALDRQVGLQLT